MNALSNEFLTNACNEWRERLSEGNIHTISFRIYRCSIYLLTFFSHFYSVAVFLV